MLNILLFIMCYFIKIKNEHIWDGPEKRLGVYHLYFFSNVNSRQNIIHNYESKSLWKYGIFM